MAKHSIATYIKKKNHRGSNKNKQRKLPGQLINGLTPKNIVALDAYFSNGFHQGQAMTAAGYSPNTAANFFKKVAIQNEINRRLNLMQAETKKISKKLHMDKDRIITELAKIAFAPVETPNIKTDANGWVQGADAEEVEGLGLLEPVAAKDKKVALDSLAKIEGLFIDRIKHEGEVNLVELILQGRKRLAEAE